MAEAFLLGGNGMAFVCAVYGMFINILRNKYTRRAHVNKLLHTAFATCLKYFLLLCVSGVLCCVVVGCDCVFIWDYAPLYL